MKDLVEAGLVSTNGSYKDIDYISLKRYNRKPKISRVNL